MPGLTKNPAIIFAKSVEDGEHPVAGEHLVYDESRTIDLDNVDLRGGYLTETILLTPEPVMRVRMRPREKAEFLTTFNIGEPVVNFGVVKVLRSEKEGIKVGDYLTGHTPWQKYTVQPYVEGRVKFNPSEWKSSVKDIDSLLPLTPTVPPKGASIAQLVGALGAPGLTVYCILRGMLKVEKGDTRTLFVSGGASSIGLIVIQLAKYFGFKVIASAGSDKKVQLMLSLGADHAFNYKTEGYMEPLAKYGPIDVVYDTVGADALEAALENVVPEAEIICAGSIDYGVPMEQRYSIKNVEYIFQKRLTIRGYNLKGVEWSIAEFYQEMPKLLEAGVVHSEILRIDGLEKGAQAIVDMLTGNKGETGKPVVFVDVNAE